MIRKNKAVACLMLITMLLSGIPEGFGIVSDVYAAETAASAEEAEGAEELDVDVSGQTAVAESDGFSYYTVEFTYNNLQYVLNGGESVPLSEILSTVGLVGKATDVKVSNPELFSASKENGKWMITAHKAFTSEELMKVTINGTVYEITVTDDPEASGTCGENLTWTLASGTLTISGTGSMTDWSSRFDVPWYNNMGDITKVVIESGVTTIGINAFYECVNLTSVKIPSTVTSIGQGAFYKCSSLTSVDIAASSNLTSIGWAAFFECSSLASIEIPSRVTSIGQSAFNSCTKLEFAVLKGTINVDESGEYVFGNCDTGDNELLVYYRGDNFDDVKSKFSIRNMTNTFTISYSQELSHEYDGSAYSPMPTVYYGQALEEGKDYTLSYQKNIDADVWENVENAADVKDVGLYRVVAKGVEGTYYDGMTTYGTYDGGSFSISPRSVTITAASEKFSYDGTPHSNSNYNVDGLVGNDKITATVTGFITFPSKSPVANEVKSYKFTTGTAGNYTVSTVDGALTMVNAKRPITITAASAKKTYDGTALTNKNVTVTSGELFTGDTLEAEATGSATNVADTALGNNPIAEGYKVMHGNTDVTANYAITTVNGTLTITPRPATVKSPQLQQQTIELKRTKYSYKSKQLKKKAKKFKIKAVYNNGSAHSTVSFKITKYPKGGKKYIKVDKKGNVTLKKNAKKGIYKIRISLAETSNMNSASTTITIKVK